MKASGSLIFEWLDLALAALVTGALSISSLLLMFGVRHNYVVTILYREGKVIHLYFLLNSASKRFKMH